MICATKCDKCFIPITLEHIFHSHWRFVELIFGNFQKKH